MYWLHITDLHMKKENDADQQNFCGALIESCTKQQIKADFVVATGDFHNYGDNEDYCASIDFLRRLMTALSLDIKKDLFIVPGNHDVDHTNRAENVKAFLAYAKSKATGQTLEKTVDQRRNYAAALTAYPELLQSLLGDFNGYRGMARTLVPAYHKCEKTFLDPAGVHVRTWENKINILHLNTAILSDGRRGHAEATDINQACSKEIRDQLNNGLPTIVLGHHSFHDLHKTIKDRLIQLFNQTNVWAYFAGDIHRPNYYAGDYLIDRKTGVEGWPNIIAGKTSASVDDNYSEFGAVLCRWDEHSTATLTHLRWEPGSSGSRLSGLTGDTERSFPMRSDVDSQLYYILLDRLTEIRDSHPSFQLMKIDEELFPNACTHLNLADCMVSIGNGGNPQTVCPLSEFFRSSWMHETQNHLTIEGEGGIGKTVAVLSLSTQKGFLPHHLPAVYIPLHALKTTDTDDSIRKYLLEETLRGNTQQYNELYRLANEEWKDGPRLILLLDGFNEIFPELRYKITRNIEDWSNRRGVQLIITSRFDIHRSFPNLRGTLTALKLQPLSPERVEGHLKQANMPLPPRESMLWTVLDYPLMLALYVQTQAVQSRDSSIPLDWLEAKNAGTIIWNYLQQELWRYQSQTEERNALINCVLATELIAPCLAWEMVRNGQFLVPEEEFSVRIEVILKRLHMVDRDKWPKHVRQVIRRCEGIHDFPNADTLFYLLTHELNLFRIGESATGPVVSLMHQRFRDCLAAIHLLNLAQAISDKDVLPDEWTQPVDHYVMDFASELLQSWPAAMDKLWNANRSLRPPVRNATTNLLELYRRFRNFDFSELDFSFMDLRKIRLNSYRRPLETHLKLPTDGRKLYRTLISPETFAPEGHADVISQTVITPDSLRFVTASYDGTLRIWDTNTCRIICVLDGHTSAVTDVALTIDGQMCVSASNDRTLRIWNLDTGECKGTLSGHAGIVTAVAVCTDGCTCVSASKDGTVRLWSMDSGKQLEAIPIFKDGEMRCAYKIQGADNSYFVFVTVDGAVRIWDVAAQHLSPVLEGGLYGNICAEAMSPDGRWCVIATDNSMRIWDTHSGKCAGEDPSIFTALTVTSDGKIIAGCSDCTLRILSIPSLRRCSKDLPLGGEARQITVMPDELRCMVVLDTSTQIWDLHTKRILKKISSLSENAVITPDGQRCIFGSLSLEIWNLETYTQMCGTEEGGVYISAVAITPNGRQCVSASTDGLVRLWDIGREQLIGFLGTPLHQDQDIVALTITTDSSQCIGISRNGNMQTWDMETRALVHSQKIDGLWLSSAAITPDGPRCAGYTLYRKYKRLKSSQLLFWDFAQSKSPHKLPQDACTALALTADGGYLILAGNDKIQEGTESGVVKKIDLQSGVATPLCWKPKDRKSTEDQINAIAATPDGACIILGTCSGIAIWHEGNEEARLIPTGEWIHSVAVTSDGKRCISGTDDTLRVWNTGTGECISIIKLIHNIDLLGIDLSQAEFRPKHYARTLYQNGAMIRGGQMEDGTQQTD